MNCDEKLKQVLTELYNHCHKEDPEKKAAQALIFMRKKASELCDVPVRLLKGSTYKIKGYYMENDELSDIRGASTLISEVQNNVLPKFLIGETGFDPILYNGGGNLLALLPADTDQDLAVKTEKKADEYLITANSAYYLSEAFNLSDLLGENYGELMAKIENGLNERKKAKIVFDPEPVSGFVDSPFLDATLKAVEINNSVDYCEKCRKRIARYSRNGKKICGGCLHKVFAGELQKSRYLSDYMKATGTEVCPPKTFKDIDSNHIAVVYADGNNMGGIIQHISTVAEMMDFSDFVKGTMEKIVFEALSECLISSPEIVALGGDDVFLIIPGDKSVRFAVSLIEKYKDVFSKKFPDSGSTLSVGFSIIKPTTPIKVALEVAEDELSEAKKLVRENGGEGSLSFRVLTTYEGAISERGKETMMPYSLECAKQVLAFSESISKQQDIKTRVQNLNNAFGRAEAEEATLFLEYTNAKESRKEKRIKLPDDLNGFKLNNGFYIRSGSYKNGQAGYIWNDLLYLMEFGK